MVDPVVEKIHKIREKYAAEFDYDIDLMFEDLREKQLQSKRRIVSFVKNKKEKQLIDEKKVA